jgi:crotonobetainyl-CoA:carnitine CoA-transferase CaiB-like acyl-CoA transferase
MDTNATDGALQDLRVLDLCSEMGAYGTKMLADLGADVIRIEPPAGSSMRRMPPFLEDEAGPERSLQHLFFNEGKRGITLNLEHPDGRRLFRRLAHSADIIMETFAPGYLDGLGLDYETLRTDNPGLILTSITPFGQTGPYRDYKATNLIGDAMGGLMYLSGSPEDPPLMSAANQAYYLAGEQGAVGAMMALYQRDIDGQGQQVDVSMQAAVLLACQPQTMFWPGRHEIPKRFGYGQRTSTQANYIGSFHKCKDGWITGLAGQGANWPYMVEWLTETGFVEDLADEKYADRAERVKYAAHIQAILARFAANFTMREMEEAGQRHRIHVFPTFTVGDILQDEHLASREFFRRVGYPELQARVTYPAPPYRLSETPARLGPAPRLGQHNREVYQDELGLASEELLRLYSLGVI